MHSRLKYMVGRALLLHLLVLVGFSVAGLHVHHHKGSARTHVAAGTPCSNDCHDTCETEATALHVLEILGSAVNPDSSGAFAEALSERVAVFHGIDGRDSGAAFAIQALRLRVPLQIHSRLFPGGERIAAPMALLRGRPNSSRAPPFAAS
ncbi:MAG: hypothetical protein NXI24_02160 [bacterium]|nr:hypothetical protein [bacterium]